MTAQSHIELIKAARKLRTNALFRGQTVEFVARGRSMTPAIIDGDTLLICPNTEPRTGDIVLIRLDNGFLVHRIVQMSGDSVITRGDFFDTNDPPSLIEDVIGNVILIKPGSYFRRNYYLFKAYAGAIVRRLKLAL